MKNKMIRVYLADDHNVVRKGMVRLLKTFERVGVVEEASNGKELIKLIEAELPDAVIVDVEMPVMGGVEVAKYISNHYPNIKILILTMHVEAVFVHRLMDVGVNGFLSKSAHAHEVEEALYAVVDRDYYRNEIVERALGKLSDHFSVEDFQKLTAREIEILLLICSELTPGEISDRLQISEKTFFNHRTNILTKTRVRNNVGLLRFALERGFIQLSKT